MHCIHAALTQFKRDETGTAALEYGLTAALVAVVLILSASLLGGGLGTAFGGVSSAFSAIGTGAFGTNSGSGGQAGPAAGTTVCQNPSPFLLAAPGSACQPSSSPAVPVGTAAAAG